MSGHHLNKEAYFVPEPSKWPIIGSVALASMVIGIANWIHGVSFGPYLTFLGFLILVYMMFGWFGTVIFESRSGYYNHQVDKSFRWGMFWFIFSEVMFFGAFFGALFYARLVIVPWLGGGINVQGAATNTLLWPNFQAAWPLLHNPDNAKFMGAHEPMETWGLPALNTLILLTSGVTITWAHWGLLKNKRDHLSVGLACTILLAIIFLCLQAHEYMIAYHDLNLRLTSGIYGATFFMLTGFHGAHVTIGTIMLIVILVRTLKGHFDPHNHFGFEAVSWYWHFVDVVWLFLFIFVYWL